jgi:iron complex transport system substrate-binding protein
VRRPRFLLAVLLTGAVLLGACAAPTDTGSPPPAPAPAAAFPVTVEHAFGTTTVPAPPQRIVTAGYTEQDIVLALGETPVGVTEWYGDQPHATWPWAQDELGGATPEVLENIDGPQYERIAALRPDLIVAVNAGLEREQYERLSAIAPTVAQPAGGLAVFAPWDELTLQVGRALGREQEARGLVEEIEGDFAAAAAAHPEFAGVPAIFLQAPFYDGRAIAYQDGLSTAFLTDLGFVVPPQLAAFAPEDGSAQAYIPLEQLGVLNAGEVLIWATEDAQARGQMEAEPIYRSLTPVREGNLVFTDAVLAGAIYFSTPLSLPYVLEHLVPRLERAVAGDPATVPAAP